MGSSNKLWERLYVKHKNNANKDKILHKKFYTRVKDLGWSNFNLSILCILPDHVSRYDIVHSVNYIRDKEANIFIK